MPERAQAGAVKSDSTIRRNLRALRKICETSKDPIESRMAQAMESAIRWAREDTRGWPQMDVEAREMTKILRRDIQSNAREGRL